MLQILVKNKQEHTFWVDNLYKSGFWSWLYFNFRWLYLANKKQSKDIDIKKQTDLSKNKGLENKAYEADEKDKDIQNSLNSNQKESDERINQSQIEIGFTESILCNSKLQQWDSYISKYSRCFHWDISAHTVNQN